MSLDHAAIADCFNTAFGAERVRLIGGASEPLYEPGFGATPARLYYREDFAASALHEAAHWCIAGSARRKLQDFGYAYVAPPRSAAAQARFFSAELKTQTLESIFAGCAGIEFRPSADNLEATVDDFSAAVTDATPAMMVWLQGSSGERAHRFCRALCRSSGASLPWKK